MNGMLDDLLCARWPGIFARRHDDPSTTCMARGFECGGGWFVLIDTLCMALQREAEQAGTPLPVARQVKEKFGTLRFRIDSPTERQKAILEFARDLSGVICEHCGQIHWSGNGLQHGNSHACTDSSPGKARKGCDHGNAP